LGDKQRNDLVVALENTKGILSAEFCHLRDHRMLVSYDRDQYSSQDVLTAFDYQNVNARLIGPRGVKKLIRIAISTSYHLLFVSQRLCVLPQMKLRIG